MIIMTCWVAYKRITEELFWHGMKPDVKKFVEECCVCPRTSPQLCPPSIAPTFDDPWAHLGRHITMDFLEGLSKSAGYDTFFVVVDRLSKCAHFIPLSHHFSAKSMATAFVKEVVRLYGFHQSIISDWDKVFLSHFWIELFWIRGTKLKRSTAYHPQTGWPNGDCEQMPINLSPMLLWWLPLNLGTMASMGELLL